MIVRMRLSDRRAALACFLILVVPLAIFCALRVPLGEVPDEGPHVMRAESLLHGDIMGHRVALTNPNSGAQDAGFTVNVGLAYAASFGMGKAAPLPASASTAERLAWARAIPWSPSLSFVSSANTAAYAPPAYMAAAIALGIAKHLGATPHWAAIAARFGNILVFTLLGALALACATRGRLLLLLTLGLPMTVWLAGSVNQDGLLIAVACLGVALLTRMERRSLWMGTALLALLALQKPPFLPLLLLPLARSVPRFGGWSRVTAALLVAVPGVLWSLAVMHWVSVPLLPGAAYHPGPLWPGDPHLTFRSAVASAQIKVILAHPLQVALLPLTALAAHFGTYWRQCLGVLGDLTIDLPRWMYGLWSLALLSALGALVSKGGPRLGGAWLPLAAAIALAGSTELIFLTLYMTWTPVGAARVDGVQGRYFIPMLPILLLLLGRWPILPPRLHWIWWVTPLAALITSDVIIPGLIASNYYR
jgi:uncharacterized membrane protein